MTRFLPLLLAFSLLPAARAQTASPNSVPVVSIVEPAPRASPHETINLRIPGGRVIVVYGRPYTKGRTVWGGELVPTGKIWRLGADEATLLITPKALDVGPEGASVHLPAGIYSLYLFPESLDKVDLVINRQFGQWGLQYDQTQDIARVPMNKAQLKEPIHQFEMGLDKGPGGGSIKLMWEDTQFSLPFSVEK